ncbi:MAG: PH domain-containing protein [Lachnospiraceae bacterium]|nr:PH domain-containing protein [Lachnospiraceae bacterium]
MEIKGVNYDWYDRKRTIFGFPWSFTKYMFNSDKLVINTGFFNVHEEEIRLYRIMDVTLSKKLLQRIFGVGTIIVNSSDKTTPILQIKSVKNSEKVKNMLSDYVEAARKKNRVSAREFMVADEDMECDECDDELM